MHFFPFIPLSIAVLILLVIVFLFFSEKGRSIRSTGRLIVTGLDLGFSIDQIIFLGRIGKAAGLEDPSSLFWSATALDKCTSEIVRQVNVSGEDTSKLQELLSSLYKYRNKIDLERSRSRRGLVSTRDIKPGQRVRILLSGAGVFSSRVMANTSAYLKMDFPKSPNIFATEIDWLYKNVKVFFWRMDDAGYEFPSTVVPGDADGGKAVIYLSHSDSVVRSQMRKSRRIKCSIFAQLYLVKDPSVPYNRIEAEPGMKCVLEDLSESGAMILIGGKAVKGLKIKLQFLIKDTLIIMTGVSRAVDYDKEKNRSRVHFECQQIDPRMRNIVLSFVYNVLPEEEKQEIRAARLSEKDGMSVDADTGDENQDDSFLENDSEKESASAYTIEMPDFLHPDFVHPDDI